MNRSLVLGRLFADQERAFLAQVPVLRRDWLAYWSCKLRRNCADLCAWTRVTNPCWLRSGLLDDFAGLRRLNSSRSRRQSAVTTASPPAAAAQQAPLHVLWQWRRPPVDAILNVSGKPGRIVGIPKDTFALLSHQKRRNDANSGAWGDIARSPEAAGCRASAPQRKPQNGASSVVASPFPLEPGTRRTFVDVSCVNALWRARLRSWKATLRGRVGGSD